MSCSLWIPWCVGCICWLCIDYVLPVCWPCVDCVLTVCRLCAAVERRSYSLLTPLCVGCICWLCVDLVLTLCWLCAGPVQQWREGAVLCWHLSVWAVCVDCVLTKCWLFVYCVQALCSSGEKELFSVDTLVCGLCQDSSDFETLSVVLPLLQSIVWVRLLCAAQKSDRKGLLHDRSPVS